MLNYTGIHWYYDHRSSGIYTLGENHRRFERVNAYVTASWVFRPKWVNEYRFQYQRQLETGIVSRYIAAVGAGKNFIQGQHVALKIVSGISGLKEVATDGSNAPLQAEIPLLVRLSVFRLVQPDLEILLYTIFYQNLSRISRRRMDHELNLSYG